MSGETRLDTPMNRVLGLGSAKDGVHHWWSMRVSSVALTVLSVLFVIPVAQTIGGGYDAIAALYASPYHAIVGVLFVAVSFHHLAQGLQVVIEDYVHAKGPRTALMLANTLFCGLFGAAGVFAILKLAFAG